MEDDIAEQLETKIDALILEVGGLTNAEVTDLLESMCQRYQEQPAGLLVGDAGGE
jgi:hypothetical protein